MSTSKSLGLSPLVLTDTEKFDSTNYLEWRETILMACRVRSARGYLEGLIKNPALPADTASSTLSPNAPTAQTASPTTTATAPAKDTTPSSTATETTWTSTTPSTEEWDARDAWCMLAITQNIKNPIGLGVKVDGSAAEAWESLEKRYKNSNDLARVYAQRELRTLKLEEGGDYQHHIANLHLKHCRANAVGADIGDADFREIIINSLPSSWDVIIASLHGVMLSTDVIVHLDMHWSRVSRNAKVKSSGTTTVALKANFNLYNRKICSNPQCGRRGHTIEQCYWPGGGKEGQFPPGFGQRGGGSGSNSNTPKPMTPATPTANAAIVETAYTLMAAIPDQGSEEFTVSSIPQAGVSTGLGEYDRSEYPEVFGDDGLGDPGQVAMAVGESIGTDGSKTTYMDSGASHHYFANKADFSLYTEYPSKKEGQAATKSSKFNIYGTGEVTKRYTSDNKATTFTFSNALHAPDFAANLISVSQFDEANFEVHFGKGRALILDPNGKEVLEVRKSNGMYIFDESKPSKDHPPIAVPAKSHEKPTTIEQWHHRFCHFGERTIKEMSSKKLVDSLDIIPSEGKEKIGLCKDCIFGKQTNRPFDEKLQPETEVLERVHMDLWGLARVKSIRGAEYTLTMTDGGSSFRAGYFLGEKTGDNVLEAVKHYKAEAERQTGKKLKCFRMDMGREFLTRALEDWCKEEGIRIKTPAPYAHSGNGVAERTNRTIIEGMRCVRCDAGLPPKFWAELLATVIYVINLMPSHRHPGHVPAERWYGTRQDISHLRAIGSTAYTKIPSELNPSKLDSTSMKYILIGYYGRDGYKLWGEDRKIYKSQNVVFEEGPGHRTLFDQEPLHDNDIFDDDHHDPATHHTTSSTPQHQHNVPDRTTSTINTPQNIVDNATVPQPRTGPVRDPYPIAPRHRHPTNNMPSRQPLPAAPPPLPAQQAPLLDSISELRRSTRVPVPTRAIIESRESERRVEEAKDSGEDWAKETHQANVVFASPGYDMDLDAKEFMEYHLEGFQADLAEFVALMAEVEDDYYIPKSYNDAMKHSDSWKAPMDQEMEVMDRRGVFMKVERPADRKVIGLKWIYGLKYNADGDVVRKKARLVAQGFNQIPGVDFDQTYASVARLESMRMCIAIIAHLNLHLWQIDFVAAYLNSDNKYEVYTEQAPGFISPGEEHLVYRANKTVYGMMAGAYDWEQELSGTYSAMGYYQSKADPCVRHRILEDQYTLHCTYTDDVVGGSSTEEEGSHGSYIYA